METGFDTTRDTFHGSYLPEDCEFLLRPIALDFVTIEEKERRIQLGQSHYSEMIHKEAAPSAAYMDLFDRLCERYASRLAGEVRQLARQIVESVGRGDEPIVLVSLVRAGTPAGALLRRAMVQYEGQPCEHYSISIIRDRGIDENALEYILDERSANPQRVIFVDAWTAKGVITNELRNWVCKLNIKRGSAGKSILPDKLAVISDIGGTADFAATTADYAIPSGVLNAPISGLISRSVLNDQIKKGDFHGCVLYDDLSHLDRSQQFLDLVTREMPDNPGTGAYVHLEELTQQRERMQSMLAHLKSHYGVRDINHIKPGVAEATRVMLRRVPALLIVQDLQNPDVEHLLLLAQEKQVPVEVEPDMPFLACSLIKDLRSTGAA